MLFNCGVREDLESPLDCKEIQPVHPKGYSLEYPEYSVLNIHWKDWCWSWNSNTLATWCEELTHWKRPWCWKRLKAEGEGDDRGWDGWMASLIQWTWVWASSRNLWWTGKPGLLQSMGSQRVRHGWVTELKRYSYSFQILETLVTIEYWYLTWKVIFWWITTSKSLSNLEKIEFFHRSVPFSHYCMSNHPKM